MVAHVAELRGFVETKISELLVSRPTLSPLHNDLSPLSSCNEEGGNGVAKAEDYYEPGKSRSWERMELNPNVEEEKLNMKARTENSFNGHITVEMEDDEGDEGSENEIRKGKVEDYATGNSRRWERMEAELNPDVEEKKLSMEKRSDNRDIAFEMEVDEGEGSENENGEMGSKENKFVGGRILTAIITTTTSTAIPTTTTVAMEEKEAIVKRLATNLAATLIPRKMARQKVEHLNGIIKDDLLKKLRPKTISNVNLTRQMAKEKTIEGKQNLATRSRLNNSAASLQMAEETSIFLFPIIFYSGLIVH